MLLFRVCPEGKELLPLGEVDLRDPTYLPRVNPKDPPTCSFATVVRWKEDFFGGA